MPNALQVIETKAKPTTTYPTPFTSLEDKCSICLCWFCMKTPTKSTSLHNSTSTLSNYIPNFDSYKLPSLLLSRTSFYLFIFSKPFPLFHSFFCKVLMQNIAGAHSNLFFYLELYPFLSSLGIYSKFTYVPWRYNPNLTAPSFAVRVLETRPLSDGYGCDDTSLIHAPKPIPEPSLEPDSSMPYDDLRAN